MTETGPDWLEIHWSVADNGGSAIRGYILEYVLFSADSPPWVEAIIARDKNTHRLNNLSCGRQYHLKIAAFNAAGAGLPSMLLTTQTEGGKPVKPGYSDFLAGNMSSVTLNLNAWNANSCPIQLFNIEYKETAHSDWLVGKCLALSWAAARGILFATLERKEYLFLVGWQESEPS